MEPKLKTFYRKVYNHLLKTNQGICFTSIGIISREKCQEYLHANNGKASQSNLSIIE